MKFEWDEVKNSRNIQKHGCSFAYASKVFLDEERIESDYYRANGEYRYNVIGKVDKVLLVVCTDRGEDKVRIISARRANQFEEGLYYGNSDYDYRGN